MWDTNSFRQQGDKSKISLKHCALWKLYYSFHKLYFESETWELYNPKHLDYGTECVEQLTQYVHSKNKRNTYNKHKKTKEDYSELNANMTLSASCIPIFKLEIINSEIDTFKVLYCVDRNKAAIYISYKNTVLIIINLNDPYRLNRHT